MWSLCKTVKVKSDCVGDPAMLAMSEPQDIWQGRQGVETFQERAYVVNNKARREESSKIFTTRHEPT